MASVRPLVLLTVLVAWAQLPAVAQAEPGNGALLPPVGSIDAKLVIDVPAIPSVGSTTTLIVLGPPDRSAPLKLQGTS